MWGGVTQISAADCAGSSSGRSAVRFSASALPGTGTVRSLSSSTVLTQLDAVGHPVDPTDTPICSCTVGFADCADDTV
jgi:hypothetical protein